MSLVELIGWITVAGIGVLFLVGLFQFTRKIRRRWIKMCDNIAHMNKLLDENRKEKNEQRERIERQDREIARFTSSCAELAYRTKIGELFIEALIKVVSAIDTNHKQNPVPGILSLQVGYCVIKNDNGQERTFEYVRDASGKIINLMVMLKPGEEQPSKARQIIVMSTHN